MATILMNFRLALEGIFQNKLRSFLTALGIIFGVAAVIAMLGIGTGAKESILDQLSLIGANSIVVKAVVPDPEASADEEEETTVGQEESKKGYTPGLSLEDVAALSNIIPAVDRISPEIVQELNVIRGKTLKRIRCVGITSAFFDVNNLEVGDGSYFHDHHFEKGENVCIIGAAVAKRMFKGEDPIGDRIKCGRTWFTVIGVLQSRRIQRSSIEELSIRDYNDDIYLPIQSFLLRIADRKRIDGQDVASNGRRNRGGGGGDKNYHQIDRMVVRIDNPEYVESSAELVSRILRRRHNDKIDFEIEVPELLIKQQQKTQETLNFVLAIIAGISLLVGGIGIMNIMLASVLERIKEIGIRRSLGAKQSDVVLQFIFEAVAISLIGGLLGIAVGVISAKVIAASADIPTVITWWSIALSFLVSAGIGLTFGILPARKAANLDPITALRTE